MTTAFENEGNSKSATPAGSGDPDATCRSFFCPDRTRQLHGSGSPSRGRPATPSRAIACGGGSGRSFGEAGKLGSDRVSRSSSARVLPLPARSLRRSPRITGWRSTARFRDFHARNGRPGAPNRCAPGALQEGRFSLVAEELPVRADLLGLRQAGDRAARSVEGRAPGDRAPSALSSLETRRLRPSPLIC